MPRFRKKPVEIEARQIDSADYDGMCEIVAWCGGRAVDFHDDAVLAIDTLEGTMLASPGDWIIKGVAGEFYPCKRDIFEATYDAIPEPAPKLPRSGVLMDCGCWDHAMVGVKVGDRAWCRRHPSGTRHYTQMSVDEP